MLCARLLCLAAVAAAATAADMPKVTLKESGDSGQSCDLTKVSAQLAMASACDVKTTVLGPGKPISLKDVSAKVDTAASALSALAKGVNKMKCDSVGLEGTRFGVGSGCACPACLNNGILPTQVPDGDNPCQCECTKFYTGEQCQTKVKCDKDKDCNGHATAVEDGFLEDGCKCVCIAETDNTWKGSTCDTCESGADYDGTDATEKSRWLNENGQCAQCPKGWDCNGSSIKTDAEECAKPTNKCNYGASCYDSHTAAPNTQAIGAFTCDCSTVTETKADKVFFDTETKNCEYKPCATLSDPGTHLIAACQNSKTLGGITVSSAGSTWDGISKLDACKCECVDGWSGDLCDTPTKCTADTSECSSENTITDSITGYTGNWKNADGGKEYGCKCPCKDGWEGATCETSSKPADTTWELRTSGKCPEGSRVDTAAECTAAYAYVPGGEEDVAPMIDRSVTYTSDPSGCHVGYLGQLSMWKSDSSGSCSTDKPCLCRKPTGSSSSPYGVFVASAKIVKYWTRESTTQCTPIHDESECYTRLNEGSKLFQDALGTAGTLGEMTYYHADGRWTFEPYGCYMYHGSMYINNRASSSTIEADQSPKQCHLYHCLCQQIGSTPARL